MRWECVLNFSVKIFPTTIQKNARKKRKEMQKKNKTQILTKLKIAKKNRVCTPPWWVIVWREDMLLCFFSCTPPGGNSSRPVWIKCWQVVGCVRQRVHKIGKHPPQSSINHHLPALIDQRWKNKFPIGTGAGRPSSVPGLGGWVISLLEGLQLIWWARLPWEKKPT